MPITINISVFLVLLLITANALSEPQRPYHYKNTPFKQVVYDANFFGEVFLARDIANLKKFRKDRKTITSLFPNSNVAAFDLVDFDKLDTVGRTVIVVFDASNKNKLAQFLPRFTAMKPFANYFQKPSQCAAASFTHVGENGARFLIIKEEANSKDLRYILNFLANVQKTATYKHRANCFKPSG